MLENHGEEKLMSINQTFKNFIVYDLETGEILFNGSCPEQDFDLQKQTNTGLIEGIGDMFSNYVLNETLHEYTNEQKLIKSYKPNYDCKWSNQTFEWVDVRTDKQKFIEAETLVKLKRNELLVKSDWTQLPDVPLSNKNEWASYRQQLRDITMQSGYPFDVVFPKPPLP